MARTTLDIEDLVLRDLKRLQKQRGQTLGRLASELLARALDAELQQHPPRKAFRWTPIPLGEPRIDLRDKDAVWALLDEDDPDEDDPGIGGR